MPASSPTARSSFPPLASVQVVLRHSAAPAQIAALQHVVTRISDFLDYALPQFWTLPRACEANLLSLFRRLADYGISAGVDLYYWKYLCSQGLVAAVRHDNLAMIEWLHECCPSVLSYKAMIEAARTGNTRPLEWLCDHHKSAPFIPQMMDAAASTNQVAVLQWLHDHPSNDVYKSGRAFGSAVGGGHIEAVKWLVEHYGDLVKAADPTVWEVIVGKHTEVVKFLIDYPQHSLLHLADAIKVAVANGPLELVQWLLTKSPTIIYFRRSPIALIDSAAWCAAMDLAAVRGSLEIVQRLHENRSEGCTSDAMNCAAEEGCLDIVKWFHENRTEGCTTDAMNYAAENGHIEVVRFLHEHRTKGCTEDVMDMAAEWTL